MSFSERNGFKKRRTVLQLDDLDAQTKNALWNGLTLCVFEKYENNYNSAIKDSNMYGLATRIWHHYFNATIDVIPYTYEESLKIIRRAFFSAAWNECLDLIEFIAKNCEDSWSKELIDFENYVMETNLCGYRFVGLEICPISNEEEMHSVEQALDNPAANSGARGHLKAALQLMSDRTAADHRNSIKESICAVESIAKQLSGDSSATLGAALKPLEQNGLLHPALKNSFSSLYGYTSDSDGIRHAMLDEPNLTIADSKYMLVACSAFINYLLEKSGR